MSSRASTGRPRARQRWLHRFEGGSNGLYYRVRPWAEGEVGLFESFPFISVGRRLWAFVGPIAQHVFYILRVI